MLSEWCISFLGAFAKLRKATINFVRSVCLSVCLSAWNSSAPTWRIFTKFDIWVFFENLSRKFNFHENLTIITGTLHEDQYTLLIISRSFLLKMRNASDKSGTGNQTHILCSINFFILKSCLLWDNVEKYFRDGQATDDSMAHTYCMLDTQGYRHTLTICNIFCFSTTTVVARTRRNITLYVHCLSY